MSFRVPPELKLLMDRAAADSGRSTAQEIELRLQQSFREEKLLPELLAAAYGPEVAGLLLLAGACLRRALFVAEAAVQQSGRSPSSYIEDPWANQQVVQVLEQMIERIKLPGEPAEPSALAALPLNQREFYRDYGKASVMGALLTLLQEDSKSADLAPFTAEIRQCLKPTLARIEEKHVIRKRRSARQN